MKTAIRRPWFLALVFFTLSLGLYYAMLVINGIFYLGIMDLGWLIYLCMLPFMLALAVIRRINYDEEFTKFRVIALIVLLSLPLTGTTITLANLPTYTVNQAVCKIEESSAFENVRSERVVLPFHPKADPFITKGYVFYATQDSEMVEIFFHPSSGEFHVIVLCPQCW
ncbi:hypothetical protein ACX93W_07300 [Paenibacillus sp. CAU 1782]